MRLENDGPSMGPFADLFRLQSDFQRRMAEETLKYLRLLQGMVGPVVPGTVVSPSSQTPLAASGPSGEKVTLTLDLENRQRVHSMVTPMLGPLVSATGVTWFPVAQSVPATVLLAPGATQVVTLEIELPATLDAGTYRGVVLLYGFRKGGIPIEVEVRGAAAASAAGAAKRKATRAADGARGGAATKRASGKSRRRSGASKRSRSRK